MRCSCRKKDYIMYDELTPTDIKKMEDEIEYRKLVVRPKALEDVKEARAHGDLSENFEYYAAKKYKNQNESRIRYLERMIKTAKVIDASSHPDEIGLFDKVTIRLNPDYYTGKEFVIETTGNTPENYYIGSLELDRKPLQSVQLPFAEVGGGGTLRVNLAAEPNTQLNK